MGMGMGYGMAQCPQLIPLTRLIGHEASRLATSDSWPWSDPVFSCSCCCCCSCRPVFLSTHLSTRRDTCHITQWKSVDIVARHLPRTNHFCSCYVALVQRKLSLAIYLLKRSHWLSWFFGLVLLPLVVL